YPYPPTNVATVAVKIPKMRKIPRSTPTLSATTSGPGVGMTMLCETIRPTASAVTNVILAMPVFVARLLITLLRMTNAASKNTGIDTSVPAIASPAGDFLMPVTLKIPSAIFSTAPDFARNCPKTIPRPIRIPTPASVPPKPSAMIVEAIEERDVEKGKRLIGEHLDKDLEFSLYYM